MVQNDDGPLLGSQPFEAPIELLADGDDTGVVGHGGLDGQWPHLVRPAPQLTALVCAGIDHQAMEPGVEPVGVAKLRKLPPRVDERFLDRVLGQVRRPEDQASDGVQPVTGGGREDFECLVIAALCRLDEVSPHPLSISVTSRSTRDAVMTKSVRLDTQSSRELAEPICGGRRLAAMQPVSGSRLFVRLGTFWLVVAALALTGCSTLAPQPLAGPLVTVEMRGGLCPDGGICDNSVILERDGRVHAAAKPPNELGHVDAQAMATLSAAIQATDWAALKSLPFTGVCPIAFDGQELIFEFSVGAGTQRVASCEVQIDWGNPLFMAVGAALSQWVPLPLT